MVPKIHLGREEGGMGVDMHMLKFIILNPNSTHLQHIICEFLQALLSFTNVVHPWYPSVLFSNCPTVDIGLAALARCNACGAVSR